MTCVDAIMSTDVRLIEPDATLRRAALQFCTEDQDSAEVMRTMGEAQVRREISEPSA